MSKVNKKHIDHNDESLDDFDYDEETIEPVVVVKKSKRKPKNYYVNMKNMIPFFLNWLEDNSSKFCFTPYVISITECNVEFSFYGMPAQALTAKFYKSEDNCASISIEAKRNFFSNQYLFEFKVASMCNRKGHYDDYATPREYFIDEDSLVKKLLFEKFLTCCNENLDCAKGVYLPHSLDECAKLVTNFNMDTIGKGTYYGIHHIVKNKKLSDKTKLSALRDALKVTKDWIKKRPKISVKLWN